LPKILPARNKTRLQGGFSVLNCAAAACLKRKSRQHRGERLAGSISFLLNSVKIAHSHNKAKATKTKTAGKSARREPSDKKPTN